MLAGVRKIPTAICTAVEGYVPKTRVLRYEAAIAMINGLGYDHPSIGQFVTMRIHGVSPEFIQKTRNQGMGNLSM